MTLLFLVRYAMQDQIQERDDYILELDMQTVGYTLAVVVGVGFAAAQFAAASGVITVNWTRLGASRTVLLGRMHAPQIPCLLMC
jgi:FUN14 family